jgi:undecaprenyl-diphosphatase
MSNKRKSNGKSIKDKSPKKQQGQPAPETGAPADGQVQQPAPAATPQPLAQLGDQPLAQTPASPVDKSVQPAVPPSPPAPAGPGAAVGPAPEQQLGDTPTPPWQMPTPAQKAEAQPVRHALAEALAAVDSPEKADAVLADLATQTAGLKVKDVAAATPPPPATAEAAQLVEKAAAVAPPGKTAEAVLAETAAVITTAKKPEREAVAQAAQEIFNAQQQGAPQRGGSAPTTGAAGSLDPSTAPDPHPGAAAEDTPQQNFLRAAVLRRLKPIDAFDARLFLAINHLPHTPELNRFFYFFTFVFTGGTAWFVLMGIVTLFNRRLGLRMIREAAVPLALATMTVEYPIKSYFKRRRPFIDIIQAIVIGKKPGTWSFPSGHSATAFGGAWLFSRYLPRLNWLWYSIASLTAFSRVYLGDHYPGDVVSGSLLGVLLSTLYRMLPWPWQSKKRSKHRR